MNSVLVTWFEIIFDIAYLMAIYAILYRMTRGIPMVKTTDQPSAKLICLAFILLAAGDTGHVGLRVLADLIGGPETQINVFGVPMSLVGIGMMTTAYTVTFFYMVFVLLWKDHFNQQDNWVTKLMLALGMVRIIFMALPGNDWGNLVPPQSISLYRNFPLMLQGAGVMGLFFQSAYRSHDELFKWMAWMVAVSFAFYLPVILFAQQIPLLGMLMIPKTCAYLAIAWIAYQGLWKQSEAFKNVISRHSSLQANSSAD